MKKIRRIAGNPILGSAVLFSLLFAGCSGDNYINRDNSEMAVSSFTTASKSYDLTGQQIFKDLFFLQGPFSKSYPDLRAHRDKINAFAENDEIWNELNTFADEIITYINTKNPAYFNNFREVLTSGNNYLITEAIIEVTELMEAAAMTSSRYGKYFQANEIIMNDPVLFEEVTSLDLTKDVDRRRLEDIMDGATGEKTAYIACVPGGFFCVYYMLAGAVTYVAGAYTFVGVATAIWKVKVWPKDKDGITTVETERFVNDVSLYYKA